MISLMVMHLSNIHVTRLEIGRSLSKNSQIRKYDNQLFYRIKIRSLEFLLIL